MNKSPQKAQRPSVNSNTHGRRPLHGWYGLFAVYFLSGIPAIVYQTVWQRLLVLHTGVGATSCAIIVTSFLIGMGIGSWLAAQKVRSLSRQQALLYFSLTELAIGLIAIFSPWFLYDFLYVRWSWLYRIFGSVESSTW